MGLSSKKCLTELYDENEIKRLTLPRIKEFRRAMYKWVGKYFFCCEFQCEIVIDTPKKETEYETFCKNLRMVNKHYYNLKREKHLDEI